jgi:hypothetical protein
MNCPNCGAGLKIKENKAVCEYCGYEELLPGVSETGNDDFFNLVVFNESMSGNDVTVTLAENRTGFIIRSGEAVAKDVPPGYHTMVVTCAGMTEYRSVCVPGDGKATKVYVSRGAMGIAIRVVEPGSNGNPLYSRNQVFQNGQTMPILALIFSIIIPIVGLIFAIIDLSQSKKAGKKPSPMTLAAIVIVAVRIVLSVIIIAISIGASVMNLTCIYF